MADPRDVEAADRWLVNFPYGDDTQSLAALLHAHAEQAREQEREACVAITADIECDCIEDGDCGRCDALRRIRERSQSEVASEFRWTCPFCGVELSGTFDGPDGEPCEGRFWSVCRHHIDADCEFRQPAPAVRSPGR